MRTSEETIDYIMKVAQEKDISQRELSTRTGIPESTISRYVNKKREFPINDIGLFAEALSVSVMDLLGLEKDESAITFPNLEMFVRTVKSIGGFNRRTIDSEEFQKLAIQAMKQDLMRLTKE